MTRAVWAILFACALLLRLAIPQGWMPVTDAGGTHLVICTGAGPMAMPGTPMAPMPGMRGDSGHPGNHDTGSGDHLCPYSGVAMALITPFVPAIALPDRLGHALILRASWEAVAIGRGLAAPPPPSTGPPHRA